QFHQTLGIKPCGLQIDRQCGTNRDFFGVTHFFHAQSRSKFGASLGDQIIQSALCSSLSNGSDNLALDGILRAQIKSNLSIGPCAELEVRSQYYKITTEVFAQTS